MNNVHANGSWQMHVAIHSEAVFVQESYAIMYMG